MQFGKPAKTIDQQMDLLRDRGLTIADEASARHHLQHISYYRLRAYWLTLEQRDANGGHVFLPGTTFDEILNLYNFDRKLRLLTLDAIERIEVAFRGGWAHALALNYGSHGYLDPALYDDRKEYHRRVSSLNSEIARSADQFIGHYRATYTDPPLPPVWMVAEILSLGSLSRWYAALNSATDRNAIARPLGLDETLFVSLVHHLTVVRNICAHHARLWNRSFPIALKLPRRPVALAAALNQAAPKKLYNTLVMMDYLLTLVAPAASWTERLRDLLNTQSPATLAEMGFPPDWRNRGPWT